ncbi:Phytochrome-like protein cph1 [Planctomycetes bacterium Poly30]|uniref:histidine kinase n=1 Tax=Saltatorellus ferox TaxID=2528018 RepID=A0A518EZ43_9BACT|nr:Phytochrome-like protein cph1 [Planctomycetes bacterium Poly30]
MNAEQVTKPSLKQLAGWPLLILLMGLMLAVGVGTILRAQATLRDLSTVISDTYVTELKFERAVGFGGLIHDFKNAVLRPSEPGYLEAASKDAQLALDRALELEEKSQALGLGAGWKHTRAMVEAYTERLDEVRELARQGLTAEAIDQRVRFDDSAALEELKASRETLTEAVHQRMVAASRTTLSTASLLGLSLLAFLAIGTANSMARRNNAELEASHEALLKSHEAKSRANAALQQFAGIASHDLAKPIRHVQFFCELIADEPGNEVHTMEQVALIEKETASMNHLIRRLLEFTRDGFQVVRAEVLDAKVVVAQVLGSMAQEISEAEATITVDELSACYADRELLKRVFTNLIDNSLKYRHAGSSPEIRISSSSTDAWTEFSITDNGIGVEAAYAAQIFEPMQRLHGPQSEYAGFGLGLALVRAIVDGHGGSVQVDTSYESGCRFVVRLPSAKQAARLPS